LTRPLRPIRWVPATTRYSDSSSRERPRPIRGRKGSTPLVLLRLLIRWCSLARWIILALFPLLFSFSLSFFSFLTTTMMMIRYYVNNSVMSM
jgi:hypothetical protein